MTLGFSREYWYFKNVEISLRKSVKDTHRDKATSNKTPTLTKSLNISIWVVGTSNKLFVSGSL